MGTATSFGDIWGETIPELNEDRFYRVSDRLISVKEKLESALAKKEETLFALQRTLCLYDLSNTYFEGPCRRNPKAKHSANSKEHRSDAPLLAFGMVLDEQGFVLSHETFSGNISDARTLLEMVHKLETEVGLTGQCSTVMVDGGMASDENLRQLRLEGYDYIAVGKRPTRLAYSKEFNELPLTEVPGREGKPSVHIAVKDTEDERVVLCYSEGREVKEKAILSKAETRFLADLEKLRRPISRRGLLQADRIDRAVGRL